MRWCAETEFVAFWIFFMPFVTIVHCRFSAVYQNRQLKIYETTLNRSEVTNCEFLPDIFRNCYNKHNFFDRKT